MQVALLRVMMSLMLTSPSLSSNLAVSISLTPISDNICNPLNSWNVGIFDYLLLLLTTHHSLPTQDSLSPILNSIMKLPEEPDIPAQINIVPMIDVIFAILAFFIMSSLFLTKLEGLPVNLPKASSAQQQQATEPIAVTIDELGTISLNRQPITLDNLETKITNLVGANQQRLVIVNADEKVNHGKVVAVMEREEQYLESD